MPSLKITDKSKDLVAMFFLAAAAFFLIGGYEFIRSASISLFLDMFGATYLPYGLAAMSLVLIPCVYLYGIILSKLGAMRTLVSTSLFSFTCLLILYFSVLDRNKTAVFLLYIWHQVYILLLVEQYWSLINSTLGSLDAKKFNGPIAGIAYIGPTIAGYIVYRYSNAFGTEVMVLLAALSLLPAVLLSFVAYKLAGEPQPSAGEKHGHKGNLHLSLIKTTPTLGILMLSVAMSQVLATVLEFNFSRVLEMKIPIKDARTAYLGGLWSIINGATFITQFIVAPVLLRFFSVRTLHIMIPATHLIGQGICLFFSSVSIAAFGVFKVFDYSLFRAGKEILYIPLSYDARYRVKQVVDTFTNRFSKGITAFVFSSFSAAGIAVSLMFYPLTGVIASAVWLKTALKLNKEPA